MDLLEILNTGTIFLYGVKLKLENEKDLDNLLQNANNNGELNDISSIIISFDILKLFKYDNKTTLTFYIEDIYEVYSQKNINKKISSIQLILINILASSHISDSVIVRIEHILEDIININYYENFHEFGMIEAELKDLLGNVLSSNTVNQIINKFSTTLKLCATFIKNK